MRFLGFLVVLGGSAGLAEAAGASSGAAGLIAWAVAIPVAVAFTIRRRRAEQRALGFLYMQQRGEQERAEEYARAEAEARARASRPTWAYDVLGIPYGATSASVKQAHRTLIKEFHPDRNADPSAESRFRAVQAAYEALGSP